MSGEDGGGAERGDGLADPVAVWLIEEGWKVAGVAELVRGLCEGLVATGLPMWRLNLLVRWLHPEFMGASYLWRRGDPEVGFFRVGEEVLASPAYLDSPSRIAFEAGTTVRRRLVGAGAVVDYPLLEELREAGGTDYVVLPVEFTIAGRTSVVSVATDHAGGFSRAQLERMDRLRPLFARLCEGHLLKSLATVLLDTYVGHEAGARILQGEIRRGAGETIRAVICACDLRNFTPLSDALPRDALIALLNAYFERVGTAMTANGGEVVKFIGDSILVIFPVTPALAPREACRAALAAARQAMAAMEDLNRERRAAGAEPLGFRLALHIGDVMYGNIGMPGRLDFTVIGPAVNLVSRLERLAGELDLPVVVSKAFARHLPEPLVHLGRHRLRGVREPQEAFTVSDAAMAARMDRMAREMGGAAEEG